jgi:hypothetical protein
LHIAIFIHLCESYLGILPHFDLFRHFFCLKVKGGTGSRVVGDAYLQLRDGMMSHYISVLLKTNVKHWNSRWFYIRQVEPYVQCDVD